VSRVASLSFPGVVSSSAVESNNYSFMSDSLDTYRTIRARSDLLLIPMDLSKARLNAVVNYS